MEIYEEAARILGEKNLVKLSQKVTLHQQYQLENLAEANHWELPEALHITLANGLAFLEAVKIGRMSLERVAKCEEPGGGSAPTAYSRPVAETGYWI